MIPRKLFILHNDRNARNGHSAERGYTAGTRSPAGLALFVVLLFTSLANAQAPAAKVYRVPFHTVSGLILLDGQVNGKPAVLLLDTGAGPNFATYEAAGLKPHDGIESSHVEIAFGELRVACPARIVQGLQSPKTVGTLGEDFLRRFSAVRIDYAHHVIELEE